MRLSLVAVLLLTILLTNRCDYIIYDIMYFEARLSSSVKIITATVFVFCMGILVYVVCLTSGQRGGVYFLWGGVAIFMASILFGISRYRVLRYHLSYEGLKMKSWGKKYPSIEFQKLEGAGLVRIPFYKTIRLWGNGGVWGFYGNFKQIGGPYFTAYVTDTRNCVMLYMRGGERIVISPHERERFLATLAALRPDLPIKTEEYFKLF